MVARVWSSGRVLMSRNSSSCSTIKYYLVAAMSAGGNDNATVCSARGELHENSRGTDTIGGLLSCSWSHSQPRGSAAVVERQLFLTFFFFLSSFLEVAQKLFLYYCCVSNKVTSMQQHELMMVLKGRTPCMGGQVHLGCQLLG